MAYGSWLNGQKTKVDQLKDISKMSTLVLNGQIASTFKVKSEMLKSTFFPRPPPADLSDIPGSFYPTPLLCPMTI